MKTSKCGAATQQIGASATGTQAQVLAADVVVLKRCESAGF
jgi:hypothetical protein